MTLAASLYGISDHRRVPVNVFMIKSPFQSIRREFLDGFYKLISDFWEASRNCLLDFLHKKSAKSVTTVSAHSKGTVFMFRTFKNIRIAWHHPFNVFYGLLFYPAFKLTQDQWTTVFSNFARSPVFWRILSKRGFKLQYMCFYMIRFNARGCRKTSKIPGVKPFRFKGNVKRAIRV
jgi:hypothetical protein